MVTENLHYNTLVYLYYKYRVSRINLATLKQICLIQYTHTRVNHMTSRFKQISFKLNTQYRLLTLDHSIMLLSV